MNQHYVPRCYLKNFARKKGSEFYTDVFDQTNNIFFNSNIRNICSEKNLYTLEEDQLVADDTLAIERMYSEHFEPMFLKSYNLLINDDFLLIDGLQRAELILGLFQLYMRNPHFVYSSIDQHSENISVAYKTAKLKEQKGLTYLDEDFSFREWDEDKIVNFFRERILKFFKEKHVIGIKEMAEKHVYSVIEVSKITDNGKFVTCDRPFCMENLLINDNSPLQKSQEFTITLNPQYAVRVYHDKSKPWQRIVRKEIRGGDVSLINSKVKKHSKRFLIGDKSVLESFFEIEEILNDTRLESKIDIVRQILTQCPITRENREMSLVLKKYFDKYEKEGTLSKKEEYEMYQQIKEINYKRVKARI